MEEPQLIMLCGHCGNRTPFKVQTEYAASPISWRLLYCLTCFMPTLERTTFVFTGSRSVPYDSTSEIVYPTSKTPLTNLPEAIQREYEATLKVRNISSNACAVLARRTLEAIFIHENAVGRTLMDKVNNLIKSERIPPLLADVAHLGRQIGNLGAHFDKGDATEEDVTVMLDFLETILEYLYVIPVKVTTVKARLSSTP